MNRSTMKQRLAKLEATNAPAVRNHTLFQRSGEDMKAQIAEMIEAGVATDRDTFVIFRWLEPEPAPASVTS